MGKMIIFVMIALCITLSVFLASGSMEIGGDDPSQEGAVRMERPVTPGSTIDNNTLGVNSSDYWDDLDTPEDITHLDIPFGANNNVSSWRIVTNQIFGNYTTSYSPLTFYVTNGGASLALSRASTGALVLNPSGSYMHIDDSIYPLDNNEMYFGSSSRKIKWITTYNITANDVFSNRINTTYANVEELNSTQINTEWIVFSNLSDPVGMTTGGWFNDKLIIDGNLKVNFFEAVDDIYAGGEVFPTTAVVFTDDFTYLMTDGFGAILAGSAIFIAEGAFMSDGGSLFTDGWGGLSVSGLEVAGGSAYIHSDEMYVDKYLVGSYLQDMFGRKLWVTGAYWFLQGGSLTAEYELMAGKNLRANNYTSYDNKEKIMGLDNRTGKEMLHINQNVTLENNNLTANKITSKGIITTNGFKDSLSGVSLISNTLYSRNLKSNSNGSYSIGASNNWYDGLFVEKGRFMNTITSGDVNVTNNGVLNILGGGATATELNLIRTDDAQATMTMQHSISGGVNRLFFLDTGGTILLSFEDGGKVGIKDTDPSVELDVNGDANVTGYIEIGDTVRVANLITGGNAGYDLCVDANNRLCKCGSCA